MKSIRWLKALLVCGLFFLGCTKQHEKIEQTKLFQVKKLPSDFLIPKKIFEKIDEQAKSESKLIAPVFIFLPMQVTLKGFQKNVIIDNEVKVSFPNGGGTLDLKDFIRNQGTFSISFAKDSFPDQLEIFDMVFISNTKQATYDGEKMGLGCNKVAQLTQLFPKLNSTEFLKVNTTDFRHLNVIGGKFILVFKKTNQYYLTHLNVIDSSKPEMFCNQLEVNPETI